LALNRSASSSAARHAGNFRRSQESEERLTVLDPYHSHVGVRILGDLARLGMTSERGQKIGDIVLARAIGEAFAPLLDNRL
jgi:hypothetical protein